MISSGSAAFRKLSYSSIGLKKKSATVNRGVLDADGRE